MFDDDDDAELRLFLQSLMLPNNHYSAIMIMGTRITVPCDGSQRTDFLWVLCVRHNLDDVFVICRSHVASHRDGFRRNLFVEDR